MFCYDIYFSHNITINSCYEGVVRMTVEETKYGWTFKMNPPCHVYSCANCPYRQGYCCYYGNKDYESYLKGDLE